MTVPSLVKLCVARLVEKDVPGTVDEAALIVASIPDLAYNPLYMVLHERLRHFLVGRACFLLDRYGLEELASRFGDDVCAAIVRVDGERQDAEQRMAAYRSGTVIEPLPAEGAGFKRDDSSPSCSDALYYPLSALLCGVKWPPEVDPTQRERYLHPAEFQTVFGITLGEFAVLKPFKQLRLKKQHGLF